MAVVFTLKTSTHYQLRYLVTGGQLQQGDLDAATMVADAPAGSPIANFLNSAIASDAAAVIFAFENSKLEILFPAQFRTAGQPWSLTALSSGGKLRLRAATEANDALGVYLVITFRHSMVR